MRTLLFGRTHVRHMCERNKEAHQNLSGNFLPGSSLTGKLLPADGKSRINFPDDWSFPGKAFRATFSSVELGFRHFDVWLRLLALSWFASILFSYFFHTLRIFYVLFVWVLWINFEKNLESFNRFDVRLLIFIRSLVCVVLILRV